LTVCAKVGEVSLSTAGVDWFNGAQAPGTLRTTLDTTRRCALPAAVDILIGFDKRFRWRRYRNMQQVAVQPIAGRGTDGFGAIRFGMGEGRRRTLLY